MWQGWRPVVTVTVLAPLCGCLGGPAAPPSAELAAVQPAAGGPAEAAPAAIAWPEAADCRALATALLAMPEAERSRLPAGTAPIAFAVPDGPSLLGAAEAAAVIEADLPVPAVEALDGAPCLVLARRPVVTRDGARRLIANELVRSDYYAGSHRTSSSSSRIERDRDEDERGPRVLATGDPVLDLIGLVAGTVIGGVQRLALGRDDEAGRTDDGRADLPVRPYTYEINTYEAGRVAAIELRLLDRLQNRVLEARQVTRERRIFPVAVGRHRSDRGLLEGSGREAVPEGEVAAFEATAPRPRLSELLQALVATDGEGRPAEGLDLLAEPEPAPQAQAAAPGGGGGRVTVETLTGPAEGVWLDAERIVIPSSAVGRSSMVQLTGADGMRVFGLVERVDQAKGEAVVRVGQSRPLSGEALEGVLRDLKPAR